MKTNHHLEQLKKRLSRRNHIIRDDSVSLEEWKTLGKPFIWHLHQAADTAVLYVDSSYGYVALFVDDELADISTGREVVGKGWAGISDGGLDDISLYQRV